MISINNLIRSYIKGLIDSLKAINLAFRVFENKSTKITLNMIIVYNIFTCLLFDNILYYLPEFFSIKNNISLNLYHFLIFFFWSLPHYFFGLIYNGYYTNKSISVFIHVYNPQNLKLKYRCYERYSKYLVNKGYYQVIVTFLTLETILISYIPYVGTILDWLLTSLIYSYYCWEYSWSSHKVPHPNRYSIFENNWPYYLGYGTIVGLLKIKMGFINFNYLIASIFPILSMNTLFLFNEQDILKTELHNFKLPLFYLPIRYADKVINQISEYIKKYQISKK